MLNANYTHALILSLVLLFLIVVIVVICRYKSKEDDYIRPKRETISSFLLKG